MDIVEWQKKFEEAIKRKFPGQDWDAKDWLLSILNQLSDVGKAIQTQEGKRTWGKQEGLGFRIAAIFPDILMLCHVCDINIEAELQKLLTSFQEEWEEKS